MNADTSLGGRALFSTLTGDDWRREIKRARAQTNSVAEQIRAAEIEILR